MSDSLDQIEALLKAVHDDRDCEDQYSAFRGGCRECERYSNNGPVKAKRDLEQAGFARVGQGEYPAATSLVKVGRALECWGDIHELTIKENKEKWPGMPSGYAAALDWWNEELRTPALASIPSVKEG